VTSKHRAKLVGRSSSLYRKASRESKKFHEEIQKKRGSMSCISEGSQGQLGFFEERGKEMLEIVILS
jgi:hypothetical protein